MFDIIPNTLTLVFSNLLPLYATHKALTTVAIGPAPSSAVALLSPWLTYYAVASLIPAAENNIPLLTYFPFYPWLRFFAHIYLLLPGETQGATFVYQHYIGPFLTKHERAIEDTIQDVHERALAMGWGTVEAALMRVKAMLFGEGSSADSSQTRSNRPNPPASNSYVSNLLGRFSAPVGANTGPITGTAGTVYGVLSSALGQAASAATGSASSRGSQSLVPQELTSADDKLQYITAQREKLSLMLGEYAAEESRINDAARRRTSSASGMRKSTSEVEFQRIEKDDLAYGSSDASPGASTSQKTWYDTFWGGSGKSAERQKTD